MFTKWYQKVMFLHFFKNLYERQPKLFYLFGSFCILQVLVNLIKLEVTPFFLYGMFSEKVVPSDTLTERSVWVDGQLLKNTHLWHKEHLVIDETAKKYVLIKQNDSTDIVQTRVENRYPFLTQSFLYPFLKARIYNTPSDFSDFQHWFKQACAKMLNKEVKQITIKEDTYLINPQRTELKLIHSEVIDSF